MDNRSGKIENYAAGEPIPAGKTPLTKSEAESLSKIPLEERVKELGAKRMIERLNIGRIDHLRARIWFGIGYDFAMATHNLPPLNPNDKPPAPPSQIADAAVTNNLMDRQKANK